jgi:opacity protein-like surface antigen
MPSQDKNQGWALGGGVNVMTKGGFAVGFDYAWRSVGQLGNANFYTFSLGW